MRAVVVVLCAAGCSWTFNDETVDIQLVGTPPATDSLPRLNHQPAGADYIVQGADNAYWVAFNEPQPVDGGTGVSNGLRVVRLSDPVQEEVVLADDVTIRWSAFYLINRPPDGTGATLTIRSAGQTEAPPSFKLPGGPGFIAIADNDQEFIYWSLAHSATTFEMFRKDQAFERALPIPDGVTVDDPFSNLQLFWSWDGNWMYVQDGNKVVTKHSTTSNQDLALGVRPKLLLLWDPLLITCGDDGLRAVNVDGSGETVLDDAKCDEHGSLYPHDGRVFYGVGEELRKVRPDGSEAPQLVLRGGLRVLAIGGGGKDPVLYSRDPADKYEWGAGDGWLDTWRFMDRGIGAYFSNDGMRVRWLEHAAQQNAAGELISAPIGGAPLHLALNSRKFEELDDGRILCDANHAFRGTQNRLVVIDEKQRVARWVASAAAQYDHIPGSNDLLVDVVVGPTGFDIVRVPIPPPERDPHVPPD